MATLVSALPFDPSLALLSVNAKTVSVYEPGVVPLLGGAGVMLLRPPQPAITAPVRINPENSMQPQHKARLSVRLASATTINTRNPATAIGSQMRILRLKKKGGRIELAVVVTVAVTLSMELELTTCLFSWSVVLIAQLAFGASVLQEK